jgi:hypothetical protein
MNNTFTVTSALGDVRNASHSNDDSIFPTKMVSSQMNQPAAHK